MMNFFIHSPLYNSRRGRKGMAVGQLAFNFVTGLAVLAVAEYIDRH